MSRLQRQFLCVVVPLVLLLPLNAQNRSDPLNATEVDQLREAAQDPDERVKLFLQFARARLDAIERVQTDPKATDPAGQIHDRLQDFLDIYDELNDNLDTFVERRADLRKSLRAVIAADSEFQNRLRAVKNSAQTSKTPTSQYDFVLSSALDDVGGGVQDHRQMLAEQEEAAKRKKK
jgi:hypothetical protein